MPGRKSTLDRTWQYSSRSRASISSISVSESDSILADESICSGILDGYQENGLFKALISAKPKLTFLIDQWIESFRDNEELAVVNLLNFFVRSSGCEAAITMEMVETLDPGKIINMLVEKFNLQAIDDSYPLSGSRSRWRKFRSNFRDFVGCLLEKCQHNIVFNKNFIHNYKNFLVCLSDSQVRAFRHTATVAVTKSMTAFVNILNRLETVLTNCRAQSVNERRKSSRNRSSETLRSLQEREEILRDQIQELSEIINFLFTSVFVHRYRDKVPEIRAICITELGLWMKELPDFFLIDTRLKYLGWTLNDKVAEVREAALKALLPLYDSAEIYSKIELFTSRIKDRLVEMISDIDVDVAATAVRLIKTMYLRQASILTDQDLEKVYALVYSIHRKIAQSAGEFLGDSIFRPDRHDTKVEVCSARGKKRSPNTPLIRDLVQFFIEGEFHEHSAYLVDSLIDSNPMLKDWECMTDLLIEEPGPDEEALDVRQERALIDIMTSSVQQTATGEPPVGRRLMKSRLNGKECKKLEEEQSKITDHFIQGLPLLVAKYKADPINIANLLTIPQYFCLKNYSQFIEELESLLKNINEVVEAHSDEEVLLVCAKIYEHLFDDQFAFHRLVWSSKNWLMDHLYHEKYMNRLLVCPSQDIEDDILSIASALKKIALFISCHDMGSYPLWTTIYQRWLLFYQKSPTEILLHSLGICHHAILWELHHKSMEGEKVDIAPTKIKLGQLIKSLAQVLEFGSESVSLEAYHSLCDLLIVFGPKLAESNPSLSELYIKPDKKLVQQLEAFMVSHVYVTEDTGSDSINAQRDTIESLHRKRRILSGFSKLIIFNIIPVKFATCIFRGYTQFYNDFGDIIKNVIAKVREMNRVICAKTMALSLSEAYQQHQIIFRGVDNESSKQSIQDIKELAKRLILSFGIDNMRIRDAITTLHREGINFAMATLNKMIDPPDPTPEINFLEIIAECSPKLLKQDKTALLNYLDKFFDHNIPSAGLPEWQALFIYRNSLLQHQEMDVSSASAPARRGRKRIRYEEASIIGDDTFLEDASLITSRQYKFSI